MKTKKKRNKPILSFRTTRENDFPDFYKIMKACKELSLTEKYFNALPESINKTIDLSSDKAYVVLGVDNIMSPVPSNSSINIDYIDGESRYNRKAIQEIVFKEIMESFYSNDRNPHGFFRLQDQIYECNISLAEQTPIKVTIKDISLKRDNDGRQYYSGSKTKPDNIKIEGGLQIHYDLKKNKNISIKNIGEHKASAEKHLMLKDLSDKEKTNLQCLIGNRLQCIRNALNKIQGMEDRGFYFYNGIYDLAMQINKTTALASYEAVSDVLKIFSAIHLIKKEEHQRQAIKELISFINRQSQPIYGIEIESINIEEMEEKKDGQTENL